MKYLNIGIVLCLLMSFSASCCFLNNRSILNFSKKGFENAPTKIIRIGYFERIENKGPYFIEYVQSPEYKIELKGNTALFDSIIYSNDAKKLCFDMMSGEYSDVWLSVVIYAPYIKSACLNGTGGIIINNIKSDKNFKIISNGPGSIKADTIECDLFEVEASGPGPIIIRKLKCNSKKIYSTGPGKIDIN